MVKAEIDINRIVNVVVDTAPYAKMERSDPK